MQVFTSCTNGGPITVYVENGRIVRIRPLVADEADFRPWSIEAGGRHSRRGSNRVIGARRS